MKKTTLLPIALCCSAIIPAWAASIKGRVVDDTGQPLPGATVQLLTASDSTASAMTVAGDNGDFSFPKLKTGDYAVIVSMTGMDNVRKSASLPSSDSNADLGDIRLSESAVTLKEAVVTAVKAAVVAKQDTLEFNAGSFHTKPNATVEDLLKKLPGVEVASDGSITSGGKSITKILVDGKEFFNDDPQMASKNLPSNMVEKVQVVDRKSDLARLTGVDDGEEETVINLTVKKDMNNGWFGNVGAGYGTDGRYEGNLSISRFSNGNQVTIIGGANNINDNGFTDRGRSRFRDFGGNGGINTSQRFGINFNIGKDEKIRFGGNVLYSHSDRDSRQKSEVQYLFPDSTSYQSSGARTRDKGHNISSDFRLQWNIDDYNTIDFRPRFSYSFRNASRLDSTLLRAGDPALTPVNNSLNSSRNRGHSVEAAGELIYNHKFKGKPGRSLSIQANYSYSDTREKATTWSDIEYYLLTDQSEKLYRFIDNNSWSNSVGARLTYTEPLGDPKNGNFLNFAYRFSYRWNNADKLTYDLPLQEGYNPALGDTYDRVPEGAVLSADLSNRFRNKFFNQELQIGYKKATKKINLDAGLLFSPSSTASEDYIDAARNIPARWVWNVSPYARLRYKFSDRSSIRAHYRARTSQPSVAQLQPVADVSDPLNIRVGNPGLKPTFTQSIGAHFNNFNMTTQQAIFAVANVSYAMNTIVARTVSNPETGGRTTTYANANGNFNVFGMVMVNQPFRNRKWRYNVRLNGSFSSTPGYINGDFNRTGNLRLSPTAGITFSSDIFQMTVNPTYSFGMVTNSMPQQRNQKTHSYGFDANASLYLPFGLDLSTDLSFSKSSGYSAGFNADQWLWNAQLSYSVLSDKSLTFSVRAYDMLGQKKNITRSVSASMISDNRYNDLTRYVMFGVTWKFNTLKKKAAREWNEGDIPPPPPGDGRRPMGPPPGGHGGPPPF